MKLISQPSRELRLMVRCLELYYRQARSQKEIAQALGVSAATVSRLLKRAYDDGLVRVELDLPRAEELEAALTERFGLRDAVVVAAGGRGDLKEELGAAAAAYFEKIASNGIRVGLSCGVTLYQTIRQLRERRFRDLALYPLSGESTLKMVDLSPNTLVGTMAAKYRPHVSAYALPVQHLLSLREIERERRRPAEARRRARRPRGEVHERAGDRRGSRRDAAAPNGVRGGVRGRRAASTSPRTRPASGTSRGAPRRARPATWAQGPPGGLGGRRAATPPLPPSPGGPLRGVQGRWRR